LDPDDETLTGELGWKCVRAHDWRRGIGYLTTAIARDPKDTFSYRLRAEARMHLGDFDGAEQDLAIVGKDDSIEAATTRIYAYLGLKDQEKALDSANQLVREYPDNPDAYETRGSCHEYARRWNDVISDYRRAMELGGSSDHLVNVSNALLKLGEYEAALKEIDVALDRKLVARYVLLLERSEANQGLGRYEAGLSDLAALEPECPWSSALHQRRGEILAASGDTEGALRDFTRAIEMRSGFETEAETLVSRAKLYIQQKKTSEAKQDLERAVKIAPENEDAKRLLDELSKGKS
jgi:tetratricopeptide (TPR) repeat protein